MVQNSQNVHKRSLKNLIIKKRMQVKFALIIAFSLLVLLAIFQVHTYLNLKSILLHGLTQAAAIEIRFFQVIFGFLYILVITLFSFFISHKIAGPLYRFEKDVRILAKDGDLTKIFKLRKRDEMQELAEALNIMVSGFRGKLVDMARDKKIDIDDRYFRI